MEQKSTRRDFIKKSSAINANLKNGFLKLTNCRVVAVNDVDSWRMDLAEKTVNDAYSLSGTKYKGVRKYGDYRDLIADKDVDAVMISTTDHWHAPVTIAAALAGKHVSMEKAFTVAPMHGKAVVEAVKKTGVTGRLDSEFRSIRKFNRAVELVHNKAIGELLRVEVGVPGELSGSALRPQETINSRPGWLRISDYCNGMITNWGAHLIDIALWGMKKGYENPVTVEGTGTFDRGIWDTVNAFQLDYQFADGMKLKYIIDVPFVKFFGEDGWVRIEYPDKLTASHDNILNFEPGKTDISYKDTLSDKADFLQAIETGNPTPEPLEVGYNVYLLTMMGLISITLGAKLTWETSKQGYLPGIMLPMPCSPVHSVKSG